MLHKGLSGLKVAIGSAADSRVWVDYVNRNRTGSFFHLPHLEIIQQRNRGIRYFSIIMENSDNEIQALLTGFIQSVKPGIASLVSTRAVITQLPLYSNEESLFMLLKEYSKFVKGKAIYTEVRNHVVDDVARRAFSASGWAYEDHLNFIVDCTDSEKTWKGISESKRRQIKKAIKNGAQIVDNPNSTQVENFYSILSTLYMEKVKKPLAPYSYFKSLYELGLEDGSVKFLLIAHQEKVIGGIVCPISGKWRIHEHYIAGLDLEYKELYPSVMATWAAIDYACKNGIAEFDFMGAGSPNEDYGVRDFKAKFGGELQEPGRYIQIHSKILYKIAKLGFDIYQKIGRPQ